MKAIGVIGVGSPFGADCIASLVISELKKKFGSNNSVEFYYIDRPGIALLSHMKKFHVVYLVDAVISGKPVGSIHYYNNVSIFLENHLTLSTHEMNVAHVLSLGNILNELPKKIFIYGVEIDQYVTSTSDIMKNACRQLTTLIICDLKNEI